MKKYVIDRKALPTNLPGLSTMVMWLMLDRFQSPGWVWGVCWTIAGLLWIGCIANLWREETKSLPGFGSKE